MEATVQLSNCISYTGQQYDKQYYLRARYYNPILGRFMQEDAYWGDGLNLYAYCGNNPVIYDDPSGYAKNKNCTNSNVGNGTSEGSPYMSNRQANKIKNEILAGNDAEFETQEEAMKFIKRKFPDFFEETSGNRSAEGWHFDLHPIGRSEDAIEYINIYSKILKFRVHITWRNS